MKQVSFIHTADLHLDAAFTSLGDQDKAQLRRNELENCLNKIIQRVQNENINLLIISGDFFENNSVRGSTILQVKNMFSELYKTDIIIAPGNHDPISEDSFYKSSEWGSNVHILEDTNQILYLEKYNTCVYNIGIRDNLKSDYSKMLDMKVSPDTFNILVFHGTVDMPFVEGNYNSITSEELFSLGMDYLALGHMHNYSDYKNNTTLMINPGSPEPLGFDEEGEHGYIQGLFTLSDQGRKSVDTMYIPSAFRHYHNIEVNINDYTCDEEVAGKILSKAGVDFNAQDLYSITLTGFVEKNYIPEIRVILETLKERCFFLKIKNQTSARFDYEQYIDDPGIKGEFVRKILDMQEGEVSKERLDTLFMALQYGLQALENGRVD